MKNILFLDLRELREYAGGLQEEIKQLKENYEKLGKLEAKSWLELNEKYIKVINENFNLKQKLEKIKRYKQVINEAKNKAKSPLEHHALESAEATLKEILDSQEKE